MIYRSMILIWHKWTAKLKLFSADLYSSYECEFFTFSSAPVSVSASQRHASGSPLSSRGSQRRALFLAVSDFLPKRRRRGFGGPWRLTLTTWRFRWSERAKVSGQWSHANGRSPVWRQCFRFLFYLILSIYQSLIRRLLKPTTETLVRFLSYISYICWM